jgi:hypothetical protein
MTTPTQKALAIDELQTALAGVVSIGLTHLASREPEVAQRIVQLIDAGSAEVRLAVGLGVSGVVAFRARIDLCATAYPPVADWCCACPHCWRDRKRTGVLARAIRREVRAIIEQGTL